MSFTDQIAEITKAKAKLELAEAKFVADRIAALAKLPGDYGYSSLNEFIKALKSAAGKAGKPKVAKVAKTPNAPKAPKAVKGKRAKITPEVKAEVKALVDAGKTGQEIAKALGISQPSVQNIKKELGLVKARAAAATEAPVTEAPAAEAPAVEAPVAEAAPAQG